MRLRGRVQIWKQRNCTFFAYEYILSTFGTLLCIDEEAHLSLKHWVNGYGCGLEVWDRKALSQDKIGQHTLKMENSSVCMSGVGKVFGGGKALSGLCFGLTLVGWRCESSVATFRVRLYVVDPSTFIPYQLIIGVSYNIFSLLVVIIWRMDTHTLIWAKERQRKSFWGFLGKVCP